jgi:hypothetical protein
MTIYPSRIRAFIKTFFWVFISVVVVMFLIPVLLAQTVQLSDVLSVASIGGVFLGLFVSIAFTPKEISWDDEGIKLAAVFPGSGEYTWQQLEAYGSGRGVFLLKFEGRQSFQISPSGFSSSDWRSFQGFIKNHFPDKKVWIWLGSTPVRFGKK